MNIILLGYNGLIGSCILEDLIQKFRNIHSIKLICVGRDTKIKPFNDKKISYVKWDFLNFSKSNLFFFEKNNIIINCVGKNHSDLKNLREINIEFIQKLVLHLQENKISARLIHLGSVSVYGVDDNNLGEIKNISENSTTKPSDFYSKSKLEADNVIQNNIKTNDNKLSYTILRIANVFSYSNNSNAFSLIKFLLKKGIWLNCSNITRYHFVHVKDVSLSVLLCILDLETSKNKIYIFSDDNNQFQLHKIYANKYNIKLFKIPIPSRFLRLITNYLFLPKKIINLIFTISSEINYDNSKLKKELNFKTQYSLKDKII